MRIDSDSEDRLRSAYNGVMAKDMDKALEPFRGLSREQADVILRYALLVLGTVVTDLYPSPSAVELKELAEEVSNEERWIGLGESGEVASLLQAAVIGDASVSGVNPERVVITALAAGANLLLHYPQDGEEWWNYLDRIWDRAELS